MKVIRYLAAFVGFLLGWVGTAMLVGLFVVAVFPGPSTDHNVFGDLRGVPGSMLGTLVGYWIFQWVSGEFRKKEVR